MADQSNVSNVTTMTQIGDGSKPVAMGSLAASRTGSPIHKITVPLHEVADAESSIFDLEIKRTTSQSADPKKVASQVAMYVASLVAEFYDKDADPDWFRAVFRPERAGLWKGVFTVQYPKPFEPLFPKLIPPEIFILSEEDESVKYALAYKGVSDIKAKTATDADTYWMHIIIPISVLISKSQKRAQVEGGLAKAYLTLGKGEHDFKIQDQQRGRWHINFTIAPQDKDRVPEMLHKIKHVKVAGNDCETTLSDTFKLECHMCCPKCYRIKFKSNCAVTCAPEQSEVEKALKRARKQEGHDRRQRKMAATHNQEAAKF